MAVPIWNENSKSYLVETKPDVKDRVEVIIGDDQDPSVFHPQMKLQRWDNEANVSFRLDSAWIPGVKIENDELNGVITWKKKVGQNEWIARFYEDWGTPEGAYKFVELVLPTRPPVNEISFSVVSKDVDFFYQGPLTQQEIDEGAQRPDDVVGSYAIYSKSSGGLNRADGKEYKTGKVGHLYRAKIIDANGNETWGNYNTDLNETGVLTLSVDSTWLDNAVYPVVVDPTFGYTTVGTSTTNSTVNLFGGHVGVFPEDGTLQSITANLSDSGTARKHMAGMFSGTASPASRVDNSGTSERTNIGSQAWYEFTPSGSPSLSGGTTYWVAVISESKSGTALIYADSGVSGDGRFGSYTYNGSLPSTQAYSNSSLKRSIYATYTTAAAETVEDKSFMTTNSKFWGG